MANDCNSWYQLHIHPNQMTCERWVCFGTVSHKFQIIVHLYEHLCTWSDMDFQVNSLSVLVPETRPSLRSRPLELWQKFDVVLHLPLHCSHFTSPCNGVRKARYTGLVLFYAIAAMITGCGFWKRLIDTYNCWWVSVSSCNFSYRWEILICENFWPRVTIRVPTSFPTLQVHVK